MRQLTETIRTHVRFSDVDATNVVWHGNYLHYLEDARELFCQKYGCDYQTMIAEGWIAPVVEMHIHYLHPALLNDELAVTISYKPARSAKLMFDYEVRNAAGVVLLTASSTQLFTDREGILIVSRPAFLDALLSRCH